MIVKQFIRCYLHQPNNSIPISTCSLHFFFPFTLFLPLSLAFFSSYKLKKLISCQHFTFKANFQIVFLQNFWLAFCIYKVPAKYNAQLYCRSCGHHFISTTGACNFNVRCLDGLALSFVYLAPVCADAINGIMFCSTCSGEKGARPAT